MIAGVRHKAARGRGDTKAGREGGSTDNPEGEGVSTDNPERERSEKPSRKRSFDKYSHRPLEDGAGGATQSRKRARGSEEAGRSTTTTGKLYRIRKIAQCTM